MLMQWKSFLKKHHKVIIDEYRKNMLPKLAGVILYHAYHSESYEQVDEAGLSEEIHGVRSISSYTHKDMSVFYYARRLIGRQQGLSSWFNLYQFETHTREWQHPCTWEQFFQDWIETHRDFVLLGMIIDRLIEPTISDWFEHNFQCDTWKEGQNRWHNAYLREWDDSHMTYLVWNLDQSLYGGTEDYTLGVLEQEYGWFYHAHRAKMDRQAHENELARKKIREQHEHNRRLAMQLLQEFHRRLRKNCRLIVPQLQFAKDLEIWPYLKETLGTFLPSERAAIISVSPCSNSIKREYCDALKGISET